MSKNKHVIIAGGKTGGHLFPGIAVAQALKEKDPATKILFVGTSAPFEIQTLARYGFAHKSIISRPIKGKNIFAKAWSSALVGISLIQALGIIIAFRADFILGVGGFSSFALVLAGHILFRDTAIHEQNAFPGMTNRMLSKIARTRFISFKETKGMPENDTTFLVGNPVRRPLSTAQENITTDERVLNRINADDFLVLVTGGSQGAASINGAFTDAVAMMEDTHRLFIIHQTGKNAEAQIQQFYAAGDIRHKAAAFFYDMPAIQDRADLVISRAGAGTVSELCIKGKPAILVP
ncbi:MAG TPA: UDP-N-acetylglucosamine--N-acetylmuramyl-(pentapeptide) pyrophosphoryl-undecaprenol N-acetylglucosamine transferase, partial [Desulfobacter sp.]|nr:UDP-N-acetylglucosamine--N-acetylmuramyl-(pentapeptide) pyrophosphoryl-undecaprenol N-acetylglucosamine transferase [Desulfobacter sp.]